MLPHLTNLDWYYVVSLALEKGKEAVGLTITCP